MEEIKKILLIHEGWGYSKAYGASFLKLSVYINGKPLKRWAKENGKNLKDLAYWNDKEGVMKMRIWGTEQIYEAKCQLGYWLDWYQAGKTNWQDFENLIEEKMTYISDFVGGLSVLSKDKNSKIKRHAVGLLKALGFIV